MASHSERLYARGFAADAGTERALRAGLAGREARIQRGRLKAALRSLKAEPAARLVLVDLDGVSDPAAAARDLAAVCSIGTALIAIGSTDTADFTRSLLRHGCADYLVKPVSPATVREAIAAALDELPERAHAGRVIAFAGTAGCGASTLVAAIARGVAAAGRTATVVDLDPAVGSLAARLEVEPAGGLSELLASLSPEAKAAADLLEPDRREESAEALPSIRPEHLDSLCTPVDTGLSLVGHPLAGPLPEAPSAADVNALLEHLANRSHSVLVTGVFDPGLRTEVMSRADARVMLFEPTLPSICAAVHALARLGTDLPAILVQSHPRMRRSALSSAQIRYAFAERRPDVVVPFDPALHAAATGSGRARGPGKAWREAVREIVERAIEGPVAAAP